MVTIAVLIGILLILSIMVALGGVFGSGYYFPTGDPMTSAPSSREED
jgi:hypothetical protein